MLAVLTTIQAPTRATRALADRVSLAAGRLVVAGDRRGPGAYDLPNTTFLSLEAQQQGPFGLARILPVGHYCRKNIAGPAFVVNHPVLVAPLAKSVTDGMGKALPTVQMFQPIIAGSEIGRGYSELNDPIDQRARFEAQGKLLAGGDTEAMMSDLEFVEMLEHGMPPTCGFGFGERLFDFMADIPMREGQMFPLMRPK